MRRYAVFVAFVFFAAAASAAAAPIDYAAARRLVSLSQLALSPDGRRLAFVRSRADFEKDKRISQLMLIDVRTRRMRPLTFERQGVSDPQWSPDGSLLAFLAPGDREGDGHDKSQIYVLRFDGGEAKQITTARNGIDDYVWSPNGATFAFITQDDNPNEKAIKKHLDAFEVFNNDYLHQSASVPSHLWIQPSAGGKARRLTHGSWSLGIVDPYATSSLSFSPDGSTIAFDHYPTALNGDTLGVRIDLVNVRSGSITPLDGRRGERDAHFAPKGGLIAFAQNTNADPTNGIAVYVRHGANAVDVRRKIDRDVGGWEWAPDGTSLWLFGPDGDRTSGWYVSNDGTRVQRVQLGGVSIGQTGNVSKTNAVAFVGSTTSTPPEIYYLASPTARPVRLTNENGGVVAHRQLGRMLALHWRNDGFNENGIVTLPPNFDRHRAYPLVLIVHGGPQSASTLAFNLQDQVTASHGYIVFNPNYRGSTNLGDAYEHAISRDAGDGPGRDVMAGIAALRRAYNVDPARMAVTGWSYGGYMTSWMEGHYDIWRAAVAGAALNDWTDDYNVAFYVYTDVPWFGGPPGNPKYAAMWRAQSPITYAQCIKAPTLIMGDIGDNNVTITNSFKMYHALKDNGVTVQFIAYPVHGHFPSDPAQNEDVFKRWLAWLDKYLQVK